MNSKGCVQKSSPTRSATIQVSDIEWFSSSELPCSSAAFALSVRSGESGYRTGTGPARPHCSAGDLARPEFRNGLIAPSLLEREAAPQRPDFLAEEQRTRVVAAIADWKRVSPRWRAGPSIPGVAARSSGTRSMAIGASSDAQKLHLERTAGLGDRC